MESIQNEENAIIGSIFELLHAKFQINSNLLTEDNLNKPLTGQTFGFTARDLVYLYFEIEKRFGINIEEQQLLNYRFNSINGIKNIINQQKNKK